MFGLIWIVIMEDIISQSWVLLCNSDRVAAGLTWMYLHLDNVIHVIVFRLGNCPTLEIYNKSNCPPSLCVVSRDNNRLLPFADTLVDIDTILHTPVLTVNGISEESRKYITPNETALHKLINKKQPISIPFRYEHDIRSMCIIPRENVNIANNNNNNNDDDDQVDDDDDNWSTEELASGGGEIDMDWESTLDKYMEEQNKVETQTGDLFCHAKCCSGHKDDDDIILQCAHGHTICRTCFRKTIMAYADSMTHCTNQNLIKLNRVPVLSCPADGCIIAMSPGFLYDELYPHVDMMSLVPKIKESMDKFRQMHCVI